MPMVIFAVYPRDGEHWKRLRNAMNKQTLPKNVKMYSASFNEIFQKFINHIKTNNGSITGDLHPHIMNLFLQGMYFLLQAIAPY